MHLLITDQLTCPTCGPGYGLILLADRVEGRRVYEGRLGCANCERKYMVSAGIASFTEAEAPTVRPMAVDAIRLAALLGVGEGPAQLLMIGGFDDVAPIVADMIADVEVIVANSGPIASAERMGVSKLRIDAALPLHDRSMRGVALDGALTHLVTEAARVCALAARVVVIEATATTRAAVTGSGLHIVADEADTIVAVRHA